MLSEPEPEDQALVGHPGPDRPLSRGDSVQKDVPEDQETQRHCPQGPDTLVVLEFNPASKSKLCLMRHFFAFGVSGSNSRSQVFSHAWNSALGRPSYRPERYVSQVSADCKRQRPPDDPGVPGGTCLAVAGAVLCIVGCLGASTCHWPKQKGLCIGLDN